FAEALLSEFRLAEFEPHFPAQSEHLGSKCEFIGINLQSGFQCFKCLDVSAAAILRCREVGGKIAEREARLEREQARYSDANQFYAVGRSPKLTAREAQKTLAVRHPMRKLILLRQLQGAGCKLLGLLVLSHPNAKLGS